MMKRAVAMVLIVTAAITTAWAQVIHDPNDSLYTDLDRWEVRGYVTGLPQIRPYPAQLLDELLSDVVDNGDAEASEKAQAYLDAIKKGSKAYHVGILGRVRGKNDDDKSLEGAPTVDGVLRIQDWLSASYSMEVYGATKSPGDQIDIPGVYSPYPDLVEDDAKVGPFYVLQNWTSMTAIGSSDLYFQAGLNRTSFGPFFDNGVVVGPQAARAGHFDVTYRQPKWTYSGMLLALIATDNYGDGLYPDKYMMIHSISYTPTSNLEISYFESVVWGERFEYLYLAPFSNYFAAQSLTGFDDNCLMGFDFKWSVVKDLQMMGLIYIDDAQFNDMIRLNFDTRYKFASEIGLRWSPAKGLLSNLSVDYTAVMPYMYTHISSDRENRYTDGTTATSVVNYLNYTHMGYCLGADLDPNSDRISVRSSWRVLSGLEFNANAYLTRHGNASDGEDGITNDDAHDGSVFDDGYTDDDSGDVGMTYYRETRFLTQNVLDIRLAGGLGLAWTLPSPVGDFTASMDYVLEYGWNRNLDEGDDGFNHYWTIGAGWRW